MISAPARGSVLIVDVYGAYRWALRAAFTQIGLQVHEAEDGEAAVARLTESAYDVVVLGMSLRKLDGPSTCQELRKLAHGKDATLVVIADSDDAGMIASALAMGANEFVPRSTPIAVLQKRIEHMVLCASSRRKSAPKLQAQPRAEEGTDARLRRVVNDVTLRYEPRIDARSYQVTGFEAVPHREESSSGRVTSGTFLSVVERSAFLVELGERMLRQSCRDVRSLREVTGLALRATVPVTVSQMRESKFLGRVAHALEASDADASWLELEIAESEMLAAERGRRATPPRVARDGRRRGPRRLRQHPRVVPHLGPAAPGRAAAAARVRPRRRHSPRRSTHLEEHRQRSPRAWTARGRRGRRLRRTAELSHRPRLRRVPGSLRRPAAHLRGAVRVDPVSQARGALQPRRGGETHLPTLTGKSGARMHLLQTARRNPPGRGCQNPRNRQNSGVVATRRTWTRLCKSLPHDSPRLGSSPQHSSSYQPRQDHRSRPRDDRSAGHPGPRRRHHLHGPRDRRERHGQRARGGRAARPQQSRPGCARRHQLRRHPGRPRRERAVRQCTRCIHRRPDCTQGARRVGRRRHALSRRSGRAASRRAGQAAPPPAVARVHARRRHEGAEMRRPRGRRHQPRSARRGESRPLPRRPVLPSQRHPRALARAARAPPGHSRTRHALPPRLRGARRS